MRGSSAVQRGRPFLADVLSIALPGTVEMLFLRALLPAFHVYRMLRWVAR